MDYANLWHERRDQAAAMVDINDMLMATVDGYRQAALERGDSAQYRAATAWMAGLTQRRKEQQAKLDTLTS